MARARNIPPEQGEKARVDEDGNNLHPVWCFHKLDAGEWGWENLEKRGKLLSACQCLIRQSQFTWKEISTKPKEKYGYEPGKGIKFKPSWPAGSYNSLVFRLGDDVRMVGYRYNQVFVVIWLDSSFTLYPH